MLYEVITCMSNVSLKANSKRILIYAGILSAVVIINIYSNRKYIINSVKMSKPVEISLGDSKVEPLIEPSTYNKQVKVLSGYS